MKGMPISMETIYTDAQVIENNSRYTRFLTPQHPHKFDGNKWRYHIMPDTLTFKHDMVIQRQQHMQISSTHLYFEFPANMVLSTEMLRLLRTEGFELGCVEMYAIDGVALQALSEETLHLVKVNSHRMNDYLEIFSELSTPYGTIYVNEACNYIREQVSHGKGGLDYYVAYENDVPVAILNLIEGETTLELDGFAVKPEYQKQGYGKRIQAEIGKRAGQRSVILVADAEDTVKDMYIKQGYTYMHFRYSALLEHD